MTAWPLVRLGEALKQRRDFIQIDDLKQYTRPRVKLHAQGIVLRDSVPGAMIKTKKQQVCRAGEFLVAEIDAKVGGFGLVPPELDGAIVSSHYFLFEVDEGKLDRRFLDYFARTRTFRDQVEAQGSTNYAAIRPAEVLDYEIPLPPLPEQRRVVARIEEVAGLVGAAGAISGEALGDQSALLRAAYRQITADAPRRPMRQVAPLVRRPIEIDPDQMYRQVAVRSFGRGAFQRPPFKGSEVTWQRHFLVREGDILVSNIKAWEGAVAVASAENDGSVGSHRYLTCVPVAGVATARFICFHLLTAEGLHALGEGSPGSADRNRTLSSSALLSISIPVPTFEDQLWFGSIADEVDCVERLRNEMLTALDALLPAVLDRAFCGEL